MGEMIKRNASQIEPTGLFYTVSVLSSLHLPHSSQLSMHLFGSAHAPLLNINWIPARRAITESYFARIGAAKQAAEKKGRVGLKQFGRMSRGSGGEEVGGNLPISSLRTVVARY